MNKTLLQSTTYEYLKRCKEEQRKIKKENLIIIIIIMRLV